MEREEERKDEVKKTKKTKAKSVKAPKKAKEIVPKIIASPNEIDLDENEILKYRLINTQFTLVKKSIENVEIQKQMFLSEQKIVMESFEDFKNDVATKYGISYENYVIDIEKQKIIKKYRTN